MAHLIGSVPFGVLVDQRQLRSLAISAAVMQLLGSVSAALSIFAETILGFALAVTLAGFGTVLFGLTSLSIVPRVAASDGLGRANSALEVPRAICSFIVPLTIGLTIDHAHGWMFILIACAGATFAVTITRMLPTFIVEPANQRAVLRKIIEGGRYVAQHTLLLPLALCSVFWNFAFAALIVVLVPSIQSIFKFDTGAFGLALASFGLAAICGSWLSGQVSNRIPPSVILLFGPGSSVIASAGLLFIGADANEAWLYALFFLLGFGPSMWLVTQNSVRQLTTPPEMLGRANSVIQTAIYGIRPIGAVVGGVCASSLGAEYGLQLVVAAFAASFAVTLFSSLRSVSSFRSLKPATDS